MNSFCFNYLMIGKLNKGEGKNNVVELNTELLSPINLSPTIENLDCKSPTNLGKFKIIFFVILNVLTLL